MVTKRHLSLPVCVIDRYCVNSFFEASITYEESAMILEFILLYETETMSYRGLILEECYTTNLWSPQATLAAWINFRSRSHHCSQS